MPVFVFGESFGRAVLSAFADEAACTTKSRIGVVDRTVDINSLSLHVKDTSLWTMQVAAIMSVLLVTDSLFTSLFEKQLRFRTTLPVLQHLAVAKDVGSQVLPQHLWQVLISEIFVRTAAMGKKSSITVVWRNETSSSRPVLHKTRCEGKVSRTNQSRRVVNETGKRDTKRVVPLRASRCIASQFLSRVASWHHQRCVKSTAFSLHNKAVSCCLSDGPLMPTLICRHFFHLL